jgi:hypothetical protein
MLRLESESKTDGAIDVSLEMELRQKRVRKGAIFELSEVRSFENGQRLNDCGERHEAYAKQERYRAERAEDTALLGYH